MHRIVRTALVTLVFACLLPATALGKTTTIGRATRIEGRDRYETACELSKSAFPSSTNVVLASGETFPDALAAAPLAGQLNAPILLTKRDELSSNVVAEMRRLGVRSVFIVGGKAAVSAGVESQVKQAGFTVAKRIAGDDRYETMREIVRYVAQHASGPMPPPFVARGDDFADALAVAPVAWSRQAPIILVSPGGASSASKEAYKLVNPTTSVAVGSEKVVPAKVLTQLSAAVGRTWSGDRYAGANRYETAVVVAKRTWVTAPATVAIATGSNFPDALAGGAVMGRKGGALLLSPRLNPPTCLSQYVGDWRIDKVYLCGSDKVLGGDVFGMAATEPLAPPP